MPNMLNKSTIVLIGMDLMRAEAVELRLFECNISELEAKLLFELYNLKNRDENLDSAAYLQLGAFSEILNKCRKRHLAYPDLKIKAKNTKEYLNKLCQIDYRFRDLRYYFQDKDNEFRDSDTLKEIFEENSINQLDLCYIDGEKVEAEVFEGYIFQGFYHYYEVLELYPGIDFANYHLEQLQIGDILRNENFLALADLTRA